MCNVKLDTSRGFTAVFLSATCQITSHRVRGRGCIHVPRHLAALHRLFLMFQRLKLTHGSCLSSGRPFVPCVRHDNDTRRFAGTAGIPGWTAPANVEVDACRICAHTVPAERQSLPQRSAAAPRHPACVPRVRTPAVLLSTLCAASSPACSLVLERPSRCTHT